MKTEVTLLTLLTMLYQLDRFFSFKYVEMVITSTAKTWIRER
jgi:hypothetical protein